MLNPELLALLVCPDTHQDLIEAGPDEIASLNEAIGNGKVVTVAGKVVEERLDGALIRSDRAVAYPVREEIPVMLVAEGLNLQTLDLGLKVAPSRG